jgi:NTP pyrophosphatase (non-canonical NTP hydrolase)
MDLSQLTRAIETISERYARAHGFQRSEDWAIMKLAEEVGELTQAHLRRKGQARQSSASPEALQRSYEDELADVLGQVLVLAGLSRVDLATALDRKWLRWHPDRMSAADYESELRTRGQPLAPGAAPMG